MEKINPEDFPAEEAPQLDVIESSIAEVQESIDLLLRLLRVALMAVLVTCIGLLMVQALFIVK